MSYFNTNREKGETLNKSEEKAKNQEDIILDIFKANKALTASDTYQIYENKLVPLTSIRRAITNLTDKGYLIKTKKMKFGLYGKREHYYQLKTKEDKSQLGFFD